MTAIGTRIFWRKLNKNSWKPGPHKCLAQGEGELTGYNASGSPVIRDFATGKKITLTGRYIGFDGGRCIS